MNYNNMCLGSEEVGTNNVGGYIVCSTCDSWVKTPYSDYMVVPVHERPYSAEQEAAYQRNAAAIIRGEYRAARRNGTLLYDPLRVHVTALSMTRPRPFARGTWS